MDRIINMIIRVVILQLTRQGISGAMNYFTRRSSRNSSFDDEYDERYSADDEYREDEQRGTRRKIDRQKMRMMRRNRF